MTAPTDTYNSPTGQVLYGGRAAPSTTPVWMTAAGVALNKLVAIPNSQMAGTPAENSGIFAYSGLTVKRDTCELFSVACGGHGDSSDNGVYAFGPKGQGLLADNPVWIQRCAPTPSPVQNLMYQSDNKPTSRHSYDRHHYAQGKIHVIGGTGLTGSAFDDYSYRYEYDPVTDAWGTPIAFGAFSSTGYGAGVDHLTGLLWRGSYDGGGGIRQFNSVTGAYNPDATMNGTQVRFPLVVANNLNIAFCLQFGNGFTFGGTIQASKITLDTLIQSTITFNPSAAYTQFLSDATTASCVPGMDYDDANGVFYWYQGQVGQENRLYVITPNSGNVWDMALFSFTTGSAVMSTVATSGMCGRLKYLPALKGIVLFPTGGALQYQTQPMYFLKTST